MSFIRKAFSIINICLPWEGTFSNKFLEECLIYFKICGDGKKYIYFVRYGVCNMYRELYVDILLDMDLVYVCFVRHGV